jgi:UDP-glucuronate decarboxylase
MSSRIIIDDCRRVITSIADFNVPKNIFITGSSGMLGKYAVQFFLGLRVILQCDMKIYINLRSKNDYLLQLCERNRDILINLDTNSFDSMLEQSGQNKLLIHSASPSNLNSISEDPSSLLETNLTQVLNYANIFSKTGGIFTFFSSGEVYGHNPSFPTSESDYSSFNHLEFAGIYAESKRMAETILYIKSLQKQFTFNVFRIYHTFGPGINLNDKRIFGTILKSLYYREPIVLRGDGSVRRTFMYAGDLMQAILITAQSLDNHILNVAGTKDLSILEVAEIASELVNPKLEIVLGNNPRDLDSNNAFKKGFADTSKLTSLGWKILFNVDEAFSRTLQSLNERSDY